MSIIIGNFLEGDAIRPELLDKEANDIAKKLKQAAITTHQVRRFYDEVKKYKTLLDKGWDYKKVKPLIVMLKSKAKYAATKNNKMGIFYEFIEASIEKIKTENEETEKKNFNAFCLFFEAIYGFAELKNT